MPKESKRTKEDAKKLLVYSPKRQEKRSKTELIIVNNG
jgi:hypothetical protein